MRSSSIPIKFSPSFDEIQNAINAGFSSFKRPLPKIESKLYGENSTCYVPYVTGESSNEWAWVSVFKWPGEEKSNDNCPYMSDIQSNGDNLFSALICYSLCKAFGEKIYDDAGYIDLGREFTFTEFEQILTALSNGTVKLSDEFRKR